MAAWTGGAFADPKQGGTYSPATFKDDVSTLDPAIGYDCGRTGR